MRVGRGDGEVAVGAAGGRGIPAGTTPRKSQMKIALPQLMTWWPSDENTASLISPECPINTYNIICRKKLRKRELGQNETEREILPPSTRGSMVKLTPLPPPQLFLTWKLMSMAML